MVSLNAHPARRGNTSRLLPRARPTGQEVCASVSIELQTSFCFVNFGARNGFEPQFTSSFLRIVPQLLFQSCTVPPKPLAIRAARLHDPAGGWNRSYRRISVIWALRQEWDHLEEAILVVERLARGQGRRCGRPPARMIEAKAPKKRGRPPGSKNKPETESAA
jgi:hypothetical protein